MMRRAWRLGLPALALLLGAAGDGPQITPTRDVDVTYHMFQGDRVLTQRMRWNIATQQERVDPPEPGLYVIMNYRTRVMSVVRVAAKSVTDLPDGVPAPADALGARNFTQAGQDVVAGLPCGLWQTTDTAGRATLACITADGVLLRAQSAGQTLVEAASIAYTPQDPALFAAPDSFTRSTPPPQ